MFFHFHKLNKGFYLFCLFLESMVNFQNKKKLHLILVISIAFLLTMEQNFAFTIILCSLRYSSQIQERMNKGADLV